MRLTPTQLNDAIAWLFAIGSTCFVLGSVPAYASAIGGTADGITYFIGSIFFTSASFLQLVQANTPAATEFSVGGERSPVRLHWWGWRPRESGWLAAASQFPGTLCFNVSTLAALAHNASVAQEDRYVWRPDFVGSTLFLVSSWFAIRAVGQLAAGEPRSGPTRIAWVNMAGSILFMASALASYVLPGDEVVDVRLSVGGTMLGAVGFLVGALLMFGAWRASVRHNTTVGTVTAGPGRIQQ